MFPDELSYIKCWIWALIKCFRSKFVVVYVTDCVTYNYEFKFFSVI